MVIIFTKLAQATRRGSQPGRDPGGQVLYRLRRDGLIHHLTCRVCRRAVEVDGREIWEWASQVASLAGFTLTGQTIELTGVCSLHG